VKISRLALILVGLSAALTVAAVPLSVGWDSFEPYQIAGASADKPTGIDIELVTAVLAQAGYTPTFKQYPWSRQLKSVEDGTLDLVLDASKSADRAKFAEFTSTYRKEAAALVAVGSDKTTVKALRDLIGKPVKVGILQDTWFGGYFEEVSTEAGFKSLIEAVPDTITNLRKLFAGRVNYLIDDPTAMQYYAASQKLGAIRVVLTFASDDVYLMVSKKTVAANPGLLDKLNKALDVVIKKGTFRAIYAKYGVSQ
jgi:polar amino acid transport system substrate-binding protein